MGIKGLICQVWTHHLKKDNYLKLEKVLDFRKKRQNKNSDFKWPAFNPSSDTYVENKIIFTPKQKKKIQSALKYMLT